MMNDTLKSGKIEVIIKNVRPQYIPILCPRCNGYKTVSYGKVPCSVCNQEGFIKVPAEDIVEEVKI